MTNGWSLPLSKSEKSVASLEKLLKTSGKVMVEIYSYINAQKAQF